MGSIEMMSLPSDFRDCSLVPICFTFYFVSQAACFICNFQVDILIVGIFYSDSMFIHFHRSSQLHSLSLSQTINSYAELTLQCLVWKMSTTIYLLPVLEAPLLWEPSDAEVVPRRIRLKQDWVPSCVGPESGSPTEQRYWHLRFFPCCDTKHAVWRIPLRLRWAAVSRTALCSKPIRVLFIYFFGWEMPNQMDELFQT